MKSQLSKIDCACYAGISTGTVFAGVVGTSGSRREYSVIGDTVNLGARLMQLACTDGEHSIIICQETAQAAEHKIASYFYKDVQLKGKQNLVPIFVPANQDY
jgi:adenylate cyclase 10